MARGPAAVPALCGSAKRHTAYHTAYHTAAARLYFGHTQAHIGGCALRPGVLMRPRLSFGRGCRRGQGGSGIRDGATAKLQ